MRAAREDERFFQRNGYIVIPGVLTAEEILHFRQILHTHFAGAPKDAKGRPPRHMLPHEVIGTPELLALMPRVVETGVHCLEFSDKTTVLYRVVVIRFGHGVKSTLPCG
jgi:hypothetical protein